MREYCFYYETKKAAGTLTVKAPNYSGAIIELKKQVRGVVFFQVK